MAGKPQEPFIKIMATFTTDERIAPLSDAAFRVHMSALCHSKLAISRGHIPEKIATGFAAVTDAVTGMSRAVTDVTDELVKAGLWYVDDDGGFLLRNWDRYQIDPPPRTDEQREKDRKRQQKYRDKKRDEALSQESHSVSTSPSVSLVPSSDTDIDSQSPSISEASTSSGSQV